MKYKSSGIDMCSGPIVKSILLFAIPLMISNVLQMLFNMADTIIVGRFASSQSMAAVGSTTSLVNLLVNLFIGISIGTNAITARLIGKKDYPAVKRAIESSIALSLISGVILALFGVLFTKSMLHIMGSPPDIINKSAVYLRIYFIGMPVIMLYNFTSAILRAYGDTRHPLIYLSIAGVINVVLNLIFVIIFKLDTAGVALATVLSQLFSALMTLRCVLKFDESIRPNLKKIRLYKNETFNIAKIGVPSGFQNIMFSIGDVTIQSSINSFGSAVMIASTAAVSVEYIIYTSMVAVSNATISFVAQNYGAGNFDRIKKVVIRCVLIVSIVGLLVGGNSIIFGKNLVGIFSSDTEIIDIAYGRLKLVGLFYFLLGVSDCFANATRGFGYSFRAMVCSLVSICSLRIIWVFTVFRIFRDFNVLISIYPISWGAAMTLQAICFLFVFKKEKNKIRIANAV